MPIRTLDSQTTAHARLNALRFHCTIAEAAQLLAKWQATQAACLYPFP